MDRTRHFTTVLFALLLSGVTLHYVQDIVYLSQYRWHLFSLNTALWVIIVSIALTLSGVIFILGLLFGLKISHIFVVIFGSILICVSGSLVLSCLKDYLDYQNKSYSDLFIGIPFLIFFFGLFLFGGLAMLWGIVFPDPLDVARENTEIIKTKILKDAELMLNEEARRHNLDIERMEQVILKTKLKNVIDEHVAKYKTKTLLEHQQEFHELLKTMARNFKK